MAETKKKAYTSKKRYQKNVPQREAKSSSRGTINTSKKKSRTGERDAPDYSFNSRIQTISLFTLSVLIFFVTLIKGENIWLIMHNFILGLLGMTSILLPISLMYISIMGAKGKTIRDLRFKIAMGFLAIVLFCSLIYVSTLGGSQDNKNFFTRLVELYRYGIIGKGSGLVGGAIGVPLVFLFGTSGAGIISVLLLFTFIMLFTGTDLLQLFSLSIRPFKVLRERVSLFYETRNSTESHGPIKNTCGNNTPGVLSGGIREIPFLKNEAESKNTEDLDSAKVLSNIEEIAGFGDDKNTILDYKDKKKKKEDDISIDIEFGNLKETDEEYRSPPVHLLNKSIQNSEKDVSLELESNGQMLVDTLQSFNVQTKIVDISRGPTVTRYELQPASGVKISKITSLSDDIALNLAASGVRIEAPIPGKAAVGVEIPNKIINMVKMRELIASKVFVGAESKLTVVLGRDISGRITVTDLAKMPHLLIAGSTGSGKSVCINSFIISLLYKASPNDVKLLMVDPKVVELGVYNGIPHLLVPVVTDPRKAAGALNWAVKDMLNRYKIFAENNVRDIGSYNKLVDSNQGLLDKSGEPLKRMARIVIIIDELADLMMVAPNDVEDAICRLAQMARAAGMHLVIATQRPSVDVITGIIKANIPSRIALAVSSQVDSRTILDMSGAEKLLGRGDMLFSPIGSSKPVRVQGCFVTDEEIESIIKFIKKTEDNEYDQKVIEEIENSSISEKDKDLDSQDTRDEDPMMQEAIKCVIEVGQASTSLLQRRLRLGYARAGRLIDQMEKMGIVGPHEGSKPRQVLITYQQLLEMNMRKAD